jgi:hypothetical protein
MYSHHLPSWHKIEAMIKHYPYILGDHYFIAKDGAIAPEFDFRARSKKDDPNAFTIDKRVGVCNLRLFRMYTINNRFDHFRVSRHQTVARTLIGFSSRALPANCPNTPSAWTPKVEWLRSHATKKGM